MLRLSASTQIGAQIAQAYGVRGVPTLLVFDGAGAIGLRQTGHIDAEPVLQYLDRP